MLYEKIYFFTQGPQTSAKKSKIVIFLLIPKWGQKSINQKSILINFGHFFMFEYVNLMFLKDFETFISQKNSRQKKLYIKHNKVAKKQFWVV